MTSSIFKKMELVEPQTRDHEQTYATVRLEVNGLVLDKNKIAALAPTVTRLVFEGGGVRGIGFGGALKFMEEYNLLQHIDKYAGSSAGAIFAAATAVGYTAQEIIDILQATDFESFKDDGWVVFDLIRLMTQYGIYKGDAFYKWYESILAKKTGINDITFRQLYEKYGKTLVITGTCLNRAETYYFNHTNEKFADMPVTLAVRISMSIPLFWKAVRLGQDDLMVDGGVLNNFPLYIFDGAYIGDPDVSDDAISKSTTIGFKLMTSREKKDSKVYHINEEIKGPIEYIKSLLNSMLIQIERGYIKQGYWQQTVCINTHNIGSLDFNISTQNKTLLVEEGYVAAKNFFNCKSTGQTNLMNQLIVP